MSGNRLAFTDSLGWANVRRYDGTEEWRKVHGGAMYRVHLVPRLDVVDLPAVRVLAAGGDGWRVLFEVPFLDEHQRTDFVTRLRVDFPGLCAKFGHDVGEGTDDEDASRDIANLLGWS